MQKLFERTVASAGLEIVSMKATPWVIEIIIEGPEQDLRDWYEAEWAYGKDFEFAVSMAR